MTPWLIKLSPLSILALATTANDVSQAAAAAATNGDIHPVSRRKKRAKHILEGPRVDDDDDDQEGSTWRLTLQEGHTSTGDWSGHKVWPSALALLGQIYETLGQSSTKGLGGLKILELGCGLPLLAGALSSLGAEVCATDHPAALPKAEAALKDGKHLQGLSKAALSRLRLRPLAWGRGNSPEAEKNLSALCGFNGPIDIVIGADLVYDGFPVDALHETVMDIIQEHGAFGMMALQPRSFPMAAALKEPRLVGTFLRRLAQVGEGWEVKAQPAPPDALGAAEQPPLPDGQPASKGLMIATIKGPKGHILGGKKDKSVKEKPLRYFRETLVTPSLSSEPESEYRGTTSSQPSLEL